MAKLDLAQAQLLADNKDVAKVCSQLMQLCMDNYRKRIFTLPLDEDDSARKLHTAMARLDGMKALIKDFELALDAETRR